MRFLSTQLRGEYDLCIICSGYDDTSWLVNVVGFCCCCCWVFAPHDVRKTKYQRTMTSGVSDRVSTCHRVCHLVTCPPVGALDRHLLMVWSRAAACATRPAELTTKLGCTNITRKVRCAVPRIVSVIIAVHFTNVYSNSKMLCWKLECFHTLLTVVERTVCGHRR